MVRCPPIFSCSITEMDLGRAGQRLTGDLEGSAREHEPRLSSRTPGRAGACTSEVWPCAKQTLRLRPGGEAQARPLPDIGNLGGKVLDNCNSTLTVVRYATQRKRPYGRSTSGTGARSSSVGVYLERGMLLGTLERRVIAGARAPPSDFVLQRDRYRRARF